MRPRSAVSFHHAIGDMATLMILMKAWSAAVSGEPICEPVIVEDRAAYLDEHLPAGGAGKPGVRCLGLLEAARSLLHLAVDGRRLRTLSLYFGDAEITRMRDAYRSRMWLSANDTVCGHVCEALMSADPRCGRRTVAIPVNTRSRCGLDPMLVGNILSALNIDMTQGETGRSIAESIRHGLNHFADEHCDMRINQTFLESVGNWRGARCVASGFNPTRWNPLITNVERLRRAIASASRARPVTHCAVLSVPVAGYGVLNRRDGRQGAGLSSHAAAQRVRGDGESRDSGAPAQVPARGRRHSAAAPRSARLVRRCWINCFAARRPLPVAARG